MLRIIRASAIVAACVAIAPTGLLAQEPAVAARSPWSSAPVAQDAPTSVPAAGTTIGPFGNFAAVSAVQGRRGRNSAGPNIGAVGLGGVAGLSEFEIGPSFRFWINDRFGVQAHLGFGGDQDFIGEDVEYLRFEPTFIVAIGDFGNDAVNVRPYAGGGIRVFRTDIGDFDDTSVKPAGVGGVEFGFRGAPRLKVSGELSVSGENDLDDFNFGNGPSIGGVRASALVHYFFD